MLIEKRSVGTSILLTIVTCGFYGIYWEYKLMESYYHANHMNSEAGKDILLSILTCGIYGWYMLYKMGKMESSAHMRYNLPPRDDSALYLILAVFSWGIISTAILQGNMNSNIADLANNSFNGGGHRHNNNNGWPQQ